MKWPITGSAASLTTMNAIRLSLVLLLPPVIGSCRKKEEPKVLVETPSGDVVAVKAREVLWPSVEESLRSQVDALNREDAAAYMSYIHPDSPDFASTREKVEKLFVEYDLKHTLEKAEPVVLTEGEAKVKFVHLTEKLSGPAFRNNRITGTHILRKDGGVWKVFSTIQDSVDYLDKTS